MTGINDDDAAAARFIYQNPLPADPRRRFVAAVGVGPKLVQRILRVNMRCVSCTKARSRFQAWRSNAGSRINRI